MPTRFLKIGGATVPGTKIDADVRPDPDDTLTAGLGLSAGAVRVEGLRAPDPHDVVAVTESVVAGRVVGAEPNRDLLPERARTAELGATWQPPRLRLAVNGFATRHENPLAFEIDNARLQPINDRPRWIAGSEVELRAEVVPALLVLEVGGALARVVEGPSLGSDLVQGLASLKLSPGGGGLVGARGRVASRDSGDASGAVDLFAGWSSEVSSGADSAAAGPLGSAWWIGASVRNLTNSVETADDAAALPSAVTVAVPMPGRVFLMGVEARR